MEIHLVEKKHNKYTNIEILSQTQFVNLLDKFIKKELDRLGKTFFGYKVLSPTEQTKLKLAIESDIVSAFETRLKQNLNRK